MATALRSVFAVVIGFAVIALGVISSALVLSEIYASWGEQQPTPEMQGAINVALALPTGVIGGLVAAFAAGHRRFAHAAALAILVGVMNGLTIFAVRSGAGPQPPDWYLPMLGLTGVVAVLIGGWLARTRRRPAE